MAKKLSQPVCDCNESRARAHFAAEFRDLHRHFLATKAEDPEVANRHIVNAACIAGQRVKQAHRAGLLSFAIDNSFPWPDRDEVEVSYWFDLWTIFVFELSYRWPYDIPPNPNAWHLGNDREEGRIVQVGGAGGVADNRDWQTRAENYGIACRFIAEQIEERGQADPPQAGSGEGQTSTDPAAGLDDEDRFILEAARKKPGLHKDQLAWEVSQEGPSGTFNQRVSRLRKAGLLHNEGRGRGARGYHLTEQGSSALER